MPPVSHGDRDVAVGSPFAVRRWHQARETFVCAVVSVGVLVCCGGGACESDDT
jgi:hypothetical protein